MKKHIVQVVQHLSPGGIETMALELQSHAPADCKISIISLEGDKNSALIKWPRLLEFADCIYFMGKKSGIELTLAPRIASLLRELKADVVHTHHIGPLLYGGLAARIAGVKTLLHTEHDGWHLSNKSHALIERLMISTARPHVVADARVVAHAVQKVAPHSRPMVIRNGVDTATFRPGSKMSARKNLGLPSHVKLIGCAARFQPVKGHDVLVNALFRLDPSTHLVLAGNGPTLEAVENQVKELKLCDRVHFLGHIDNMPEFYHALDVFCLASHNEGLPLAPLEAQSCGKPVVVTDVGGTKECVCPDYSVLVPPGNAAKLAAALQEVLERNYIGSPRQFVMNNNSIDRMVSSYFRLMA